MMKTDRGVGSARTGLLRDVARALWVCVCVGMPVTCPAQEAHDKPQAKPAEQEPQRFEFAPMGHVEVAGRGPVPLVLIPGLACDWTVFNTFMARNADRYTMYACTLPGFGGTEPPDLLEDVPGPDHDPWKIMIPNALMAIDTLITDFGLERPVLAGHGLGGHLAIRFALENPDRVRAAIAIDGRPTMSLGAVSLDLTPKERRETVERQILATYRDESQERYTTRMRNFALRSVTDAARGEELSKMINTPPRGVTIQYYMEHLIADLQPRMKEMAIPFLMLVPVEPAPVVLTERARKELLEFIGTPPNSTVVFIPESKHFVMDDAPLELDKAVDLFLRGEPVPGSFGVGARKEPPGAAPARAGP